MGALLSIPILGSVAGLGASAASACVGGLAFFCTGQAASALTKSCNCNSSVATRVGFSLIFLLNSLLAWLMRSDWAMRSLAKWSYEYIKMSCTDGKCYGVLAVHRICFALTLFHAVLAVLLIGVHDTRTKRAAIQNGWWGPKVAAWLVLVGITFFIPNGFFMWYGNYIAVIGATIFILVGLVLLIDFAHTWSEGCLQKWEETDSSFWKWVLISSTLGLFVVQIVLTAIQYAFFASSGCELNQFFISFNLALSVLVTIVSISPAVQEANPRSGLAQSGMVVAYAAYLVTSAIANHDDGPGKGHCNPLQSRAAGARSGMVALGAIFTFIAIAFSTSRAATQSKALVGRGKRPMAMADGYGAIGESDEAGELTSVRTTQPQKKDSLRYQALLAAVAAGSLPASALDEDDDDEDEAGSPDEHDDERAGTRYNYSWFHIVFVMGIMYTAVLLTDWNVVKGDGGHQDGEATPVKIGRSVFAMWTRIVSSWLCLLLYMWSLLAPVLLPDRFGD